MPEIIIKPADLHDPKFKVIFGLFSWWRSFDSRVFVICQRWSNSTGQLEYVELLEMDSETVKIIPYKDFFEQYVAGRLSKTSTGDYLPLPRLGAAGANLRPDRVA